jgi:hypothetical protein
MVNKSCLSVALGAAVAVAACDPGRTLHPSDRDTTSPEALYNSKGNLEAARLSAIGDFQIAYAGSADAGGNSHEGHINMTGMFVDELTNEETFPTRIQVDDRVALATNASLRGLFLDLQKARVSAERTDTAYQKFDSLNVGHAEAVLLVGYTYLMFAENYCSGVAFSTLAFNGTITYGQPLTTAQMYNIALADFQRAARLAQGTITAATDTGDANTAAEAQSYLYAAHVATGRTLLDQGNVAGAAAAVADVPARFAYQMEFSINTIKQNNGIWFFGLPGGLLLSVSDREGTNGLQFGDTTTGNNPIVDPRVPVQNTGQTGFNGFSFPFMNQLKYPTASSNVDVADGIEAKLIAAEAAFRSADFATEKIYLDSARAVFGSVGPIPPDSVSGLAVTDPGFTQQQNAARVLFRERAFDLYLTAHRLSDLRRLVRQYQFTQDQVFPTGPVPNQGVNYGSDVTLPGSSDEANNPNFHGCIDRNA